MSFEMKICDTIASTRAALDEFVIALRDSDNRDVDFYALFVLDRLINSAQLLASQL